MNPHEEGGYATGLPERSVSRLASPRTRPPLRGLALLIGLAACEHTQPLDALPPPPVIGSLGPGIPARLTYNLGGDHYPTWSVDGGFLLYQAANPNRPDNDHCLFLLPPIGGTQELEACDATPNSEDSTNVFGPAAVSPSGRVVLYESAEPTGLGIPTSSGMYLSPGLPVRGATQVVQLPLNIAAGARADKFTSLRWVGDTGFLSLAVRTSLYVPCRFCKTDTLETGLGVLWTQIGGGIPTPAVVPGTLRASSYAFVAPDTIYFTINGDARVLRTRIGGGPVDSVFAFPAESTDAPAGFKTASPAITRGVQVASGVLYAITGGRIEYHPDSGSGEFQWDQGGKLHKVILVTGTDSLVSRSSGDPQASLSFVWMRNPVLSQTGVLAAEGRSVTLTQLFANKVYVATDTMISSGNIWEYVHP